MVKLACEWTWNYLTDLVFWSSLASRSPKVIKKALLDVCHVYFTLSCLFDNATVVMFLYKEF